MNVQALQAARIQLHAWIRKHACDISISHETFREALALHSVVLRLLERNSAAAR